MNVSAQCAAPPAYREQSTRLGYLWLWNYGSFFGLTLLFAVQALMFYTQLADQILPYYPRAYDQTSYAVATYRLIARFHAEGWSVFLQQLLNPPASGMTFVPQGAILSLVGGPNRGAFNSLNLIYFIALQACLFVTVRSRTNNLALAWISIAFLLSVKTHFYFAGGLYDYRMDYSALCLYGVWCCLLLASRTFRNWSAIFGLGIVSAFLVLERFFTVLYIGTVLAILFLALSLAAYFARTTEHRKSAAKSAKNLFICGGLVALVTLPFLFLARSAIFNYYVVGHFFGVEKNIRAAEVGISTLFDDLTYYPWNLAIEHFGKPSIEFIAIVLASVTLIYRLSEGATIRRALRELGAYRFEFLALILAVAVPLVFLTIDVAKSPVVGEIVIVPCILALVLFASLFTKAQESPLQGVTYRGTAIRQRAPFVSGFLTSVVVIVATAMFLTNGTASQHYLHRIDLVRVSNINRAIAGYVIDNGIPSPTISVDRVLEYLNAGTIQLYGYEGWRHFIDIVPKFGHGDNGIFATPREVAMKLLRESDIVVLSDPVIGRENSAYPMDSKIGEYWGEMWQWTNANLMPLYATEIGGIPYRAFHKPFARSEGGSRDWITSRGLTLTVNRSELRRWPFIVLDGNYSNESRAGQPQPRAVAMSEGEPIIELPAKLETSDARYHLVIDARAVAHSSGVAKIQLTFDRYFVPKERGINEDTRELVIRLPTSEALRANDDDR
jgi:hypothetical protein